MKNLFSALLLVLAVVVSHSTLAQTIRRVNNTGTAPAGVNIYSTLQAAHDASVAGDIIYLEPSNITYGNLNCNRQLTIIGNGYFLQQNPGLQVDTRESIVDNIYFLAGSTGSRITGCTIQSTYLSINASNITVERNRLSTNTYIGYHPQTGAYTTVNNILIRQNYTGYIYIHPSTSTSVSNVSITNNIIIGNITTSGQFNFMSSILIANNVVGDIAGNNGYNIDVDNAVIKNNILTYRSSNNFTLRNNVTSYNISGNTQFGTANGNQSSVNPSAIFVSTAPTFDGSYQLKAGSPAIGTGESGTDVGAFGGMLPYRLAGIPNVPTIYQYNQSVSGNSLNATISTKSNN